jgi:hypothetical protein
MVYHVFPTDAPVRLRSTVMETTAVSVNTDMRFELGCFASTVTEGSARISAVTIDLGAAIAQTELATGYGLDGQGFGV